MKILISGANGKMGKKVAECATNNSIDVACGVDRIATSGLFPVYDNFDKVTEKVDCIIDFSSPSNLESLLKFAIKNNICAVLCTTGYTNEDIEKINEASNKIAIFRSANMSLGVNVLINLVKKASEQLKDFDIEIIEKHHNQKADAPSGTAKMLADAVIDVCPEKYCTYGRNGIVGKRKQDEIGVHAIRGGNIVGIHDVMFAGENEIITLSHEATDRGVFANGAIKASQFLVNKKKGLFDMNDLLSEING